MQLFGNAREVQQGEEWNLDILISQSSTEYVPFIVSSERINPMWTITVASTKYEKNERYVATWWLELIQTNELKAQQPLPRFFQTTPYYIGEVSTGTVINRPIGDPPMYALYQYTRSEDEVDLELGRKPYYYVYFTEDDPNTPRYDYECRIRMQFRSSETADWGSQNYMYQIMLVDTIPMTDHIRAAYEAHPDLQWRQWVTRDNPDWDRPVQEPNELDEIYYARVEESWRIFENNWMLDNVNELFTFITNRIPGWFQSDIDADAPVGHIDIPQVILPPTNLQVNNNLRRII